MQISRTRHFFFSAVTIIAGLLLSSCSSTRNAVPSQIGLLPLDGYNYTGNSPEADTVYRVIRNEAAFNASFGAENAARKPNFSGQTVVAIVLRGLPSTPLQFSRAETAGTVINVYAQTCTGCSSSGVVAATIPNVGSVRSVRFFINGESKTVKDL